MGGFQTEGANAFGWAELNTRGIDQAISFYETVFGWTHDAMPAGGRAIPRYTTFYLTGDRVGGAMPMDAAMPANIPSYWMPYFGVDDVDAAFERAKALGAQEMVAPTDFPGGRFAIVERPAGGDVRPDALRELNRGARGGSARRRASWPPPAGRARVASWSSGSAWSRVPRLVGHARPRFRDGERRSGHAMPETGPNSGRFRRPIGAWQAQRAAG